MKPGSEVIWANQPAALTFDPTASKGWLASTFMPGICCETDQP